MKAIGFTRSLPVTDEHCLFEFETAVPEPGARDLLVRVHAASVNPADTKVRRNAAAENDLDSPWILGFDAAGVVEQVGSEVEFFKVGDAVWYAGSIDRSGSNAQWQLVDERIVGHRPQSLSAPQAAALPLTGITAWEALYDRLRIPAEQSGTLLIIGGAGGVGSITIQLARQMTNLKVIATASREETKDWCLQQGADLVANHRSLEASMRELGVDSVDYILNCADTSGYWDAMANLIAPEGKIASIVEASAPVDLQLLMHKSATFAWEMMSTRPMFGTDSMVRQHVILEQLASYADSGQVITTMTDCLTGLSAKTLIEGHRRIESGNNIGKLSIDYNV